MENAELLLKLGSAILGILYVFGLLISNLQLMELGVSDFSSLQVRNIMTGFLFLAYVLLLLLALSPALVPMILWEPMIKGLSKSRKIWVLIVVVFGMGIPCIYSVGGMLGYLYPWGKKWEALGIFSSFDWMAIKSDVHKVIGQVLESYQHSKVIWATIMILSLTAFYLILRADKKEDLNYFFVFYFWLPIPFLLVSFAEDVYPNMRYNLGGGQPQVAELQTSEEKEGVAALPGRTLYYENTNHKEILGTEPVAIWYQSDKFLYISPLPRGGQGIAQMVAIKIEMIRTIHYLRKYVKVKSGRRIVSVGSY